MTTFRSDATPTEEGQTMWVRVDAQLTLHRKTYRAARLMGIDRAATAGLLTRLWGYAAEHHVDGDVTDCEWQAVVEQAGVLGVSGETMVAALTEAGWLVEREGRVLIHDWHDHQGVLVERRTREAERHRARRARHREPDGEAPEDASESESVALALSARTAVDIRRNAEVILTGMREDRVRMVHREGLMARVWFAYWSVKMGRSNATRLDARREARIRARLQENGHDLNELLYVVDGALRDDFIMGRDPRGGGRKYDGVETLLRDRAQVERFSAMVPAFGRGEPHPFLRRLNEASDNNEGGATDAASA